MRPIPHSDEIRVFILIKLPDIVDYQLRSSTSSSTSGDDEDIVHEAWNADGVCLYSQSELNDLKRELNLPKQSTKVQASRLQKKASSQSRD